jgi:hypothetical protein
MQRIYICRPGRGCHLTYCTIVKSIANLLSSVILPTETANMSNEKSHPDTIEPARLQGSSESIDISKVDVEDGEIFKRGEGTVDFRTVSWVHTSVIFLKLIFATGVLTIPSAMYTLGALPGAINVLGWQFLNTWCALILGQFRQNHAGCHSIADMGALVGGKVVKEITGMSSKEAAPNPALIIAQQEFSSF